MAVSRLWEKTSFLNPDINFLISHYIREYDLRKAGPNVLLHYGGITKEQYDWLIVQPDRQVQEGLLIKANPDLAKIKSEGIKEMRKQLFTANNIQDWQVVSIKNDAVFIVDTQLATTKFADNLEFIPKNTYTSYYKNEHTELYYMYDQVTQSELLDVKGIGNDRLKLHEDYFCDFILEMCKNAQIEKMEDLIQCIQAFSEDYLALKLPVGYYREFNASSKYKMKISSLIFAYYSEAVLDNDKVNIDISTNYNWLRYFHKVFTQLYFSKR